MPTYKILKYGEQEKRDQFVHGRVRLVALLVSGLLFLATVALLYSHAVHHPV